MSTEPSADAMDVAREFLKFTPDQKLGVLELQMMRILASYTDWLYEHGFMKGPPVITADDI